MANSKHIKLDSRFPEIAAAAQPRARGVVVRTVAELKAKAKANAPVDTGELRDSIYGRTPWKLGGEVFASAPHAFFVEFGTARTAARPYMTPAVEDVRPAFYRALGEIIR